MRHYFVQRLNMYVDDIKSLKRWTSHCSDKSIEAYIKLSEYEINLDTPVFFDQTLD